MREYVLAYDVGTTAIKTCLYEMNDQIHRVASSSEGYGLYFFDHGGVEQDPNEWWDAMGKTTKAVMVESGIAPESVIGLSFCAQMQGVVLVDEKGNPIRNAMSYMDNRGSAEMEKNFGKGFKVEGTNLWKLLKSIAITGLVATSAKDPVWKYNWVKSNEPELYTKIYKWLDVKEFLVAKASGKFVMTEDSAYASMLMDVKKRKFSRRMCKMHHVDIRHMPEIVSSTKPVGVVTCEAALHLGLMEGIPVYGGGGDASLLGVGAGATRLSDTHIYLGTSGWVSTVVNRPFLDITNRIAGIVGANHRTFNYFAELETAGKCIEWVRDHLAFDEFNTLMSQQHHTKSEEATKIDLYQSMMEAIKDVPPGSNGVLFTPWLHGNRSPFEDPNAKGMFFNLGLQNGKRDMIHAVIEGVCFHLKWQLEASKKKAKTSSIVRLVGGGALAAHTCQTLADILNLTVEVTKEPQNAGALGAVILVAVGTKRIKSIESTRDLVEVEHTYQPDSNTVAIYTERFEVFKSLYANNRKAFKTLNQPKPI